MMLALSLWQPWASAIAVGAKKIETRGFGTGYRGPLAIHAAKKWTWELAGDALAMIRRGVPLPVPVGRETGNRLPRFLPLGAVVCVAQLVDCVRMTEEWVDKQTDFERSLGGYEPGRWGWVLEDVQPLAEPCALRGRQGLWTLSPDEERDVLKAVARG